MSSSIRLCQAAGFEDCWQQLLEPWFRIKVSTESMSSGRPTVVIVPNQAYGAFLKQKVLNAGLPLFSIHFWSLGNLREFLLKTSRSGGDKRLALREDLHFFMAVAAADGEEEEVFSEILEEQPDEFVRTLDMLKAAGHESKSLDGELWAEVASRYEKLLAHTGLQTSQEADWRLCRERATTGKLIDSMLIVGFSARHWEWLALLRAGCAHASETLVCLPLARDSQPERIWTGAWEEFFGEAETVPAAEPVVDFPFSGLCLNYSLDLPGAPENASGDFYLADHVRQEAEVITACACTYLEDPKCARLGILTPSGSILGREVASRLARLKIPFLDNIGHYPVQSTRQGLLNRWLDFQRDQSLPSFHMFLRSRRNLDLGSAKLFRSSERDLKEATRVLLTGHLGVIRSWLGKHRPEGNGFSVLNQWPALPPLDSFAGFLQASLGPLDRLGWKSELEILASRAEPLKKALVLPVKRSVFLRWLGDILRTPGRTRYSCGRQSLSPLHLLTYEQAEGQDFSHLILGGLNHGLWPPEPPLSPFLPDELLQALNRNSLAQGSQGEGHLAVKKDRSLLLGAGDLRQLSRDAFAGLLESTGCRLAATASLKAEDDFSRAAAPSELFLKLYRADTGGHLDDKTMAELAAATRQWIPPFPQTGRASIDTKDRDRFLRAHTARRNKKKPFGEFEFAYREPPPGGVALSCKNWETVLARPASVWMNTVTGIRKDADFSEPVNWPMTIGIWVHEWLGLDQDAADDDSMFTSFPLEGGWARQVDEKARRLQKAVREAYKKSGRTLPDWWISGWSQALRIASGLADSLDALEGWAFARSEWDLPPATEMDLPLTERNTLPVSGRIDLLLSQKPLESPQSERAWAGYTPLWVIDFKTGKDRPLHIKDLQKGKGLQVALYALALHSMGAEDVSLSVLKVSDALTNPLSWSELQATELRRIWAGLSHLQQSGVLGMTGPVRAKYGVSAEYPLATLPLDIETLRVKWEITHPLLPYTKSS